MKHTESVMCYLCKRQDIKKLHRLKETNVYFCKNCSVIFLHPRLSEERLKNIYKKEYYHSWGILEGDIENLRKMKMATADLWLKKVEKYIKPGMLLDVGCAMGFFMEKASQRGWKPYGVEISEYSSDFARKNFPDSVFTGTLDKIEFSENSFDCLVMSDFIEHLKNPEEIVEVAGKILRKDGILLISTPKAGGISQKFFGKFWMHYKLEHLFYFTPYAIKTLMSRCGFKTLSITPAYKALTLDYLYCQLKIYPVPLLIQIVALLKRLVGDISKKTILLRGGEMLVIAKNTKGK